MPVTERTPVFSRYIEVYFDESGETKSCIVALYKGIDIEELRTVLNSVLLHSADANYENRRIVAFEDVENRVVLSISLACNQPELLHGARYKVLVEYAHMRDPYEQELRNFELRNGEKTEDPDRITTLNKAVSTMLRTRLINEDMADMLLQLIEERDERTIAAYQVYCMDENMEELIDTLHRLSILTNRENDEEQTEMELTNVDLINIVSTLENKGYLDEEQCIVLGRLSEMEHALVKAACEVYLQEKDESDLADTLKRVSKHLSITRIIEALLKKSIISELQFKHLHQMFFEGEPQLLQNWSTFCVDRDENKFVQFLYSLLESIDASELLKKASENSKLNQEEIDIITGLLDEGDETLESVFNSYLVDKDFEEICEILRIVAHIARSEKSDTLKLCEGIEHPGIKLFALLKELEDEEELNHEEMENLLAKILHGDRELFMLYNTYLISDDFEQFLASVKEVAGKRFDMIKGYDDDMQMLNTLYKLVESNTLNTEQGKQLGYLLEVEDERLLAAFDVYNDEQNLEDLADTLKRLCVISQETNHSTKDNTPASPASSATYDEDEFLDDDDLDDDDSLQNDNDNEDDKE